tara:strand:- start:52 stop:453 length:402 start_codon:yes stop_codon:yes gene_type:complete
MMSVEKNTTILLVDDSKCELILFSKMLKKILNNYYENFEIITLESGEQCLKYFEENNDIDIIIMDEIMEGLSGCNTNKLLREKSYKNIIIHHSGNCDEEDKLLYYDSGANYIIPKGLSFTETNDIFENIINDL